MTTQTDPQSLINHIVGFYGTYLSCSREQLDILALWTFHTHAAQNAPFSPALNIHSREKQSGKTTCLELLQMLCDHSFFHTSPSPALVVRQTQGLEKHPFTGTLLLDDCRFSTALQGVLSASFRWSGRQIARSKNEAGDYVFQERINFFPKAFAGNRRLPDCLRDLSIPIALEPKQSGSLCRRFHQDATRGEAGSLRAGLQQWYKDHTERLAKIPPYGESQFPPELSCRRQDCAEPLLVIADLIGGEWPQRARVALVNAFALDAFDDLHSSKQILADIREVFMEKGNPVWLSTADVLEFLHIMDDRTWDEWSKGKPITSKDLGGLLAPFGIKSKNHRTEEGNKGAHDKIVKDKVVKGYSLESFEKSWQKYLPELCKEFPLPQRCGTATPGCGEDTEGSPVSVAAKSQNLIQTQHKPIAGNANARGSQYPNPSPKGEIIAPSTSVLGNGDRKLESRRDGMRPSQPEKNLANSSASTVSSGVGIPNLLHPVAAKSQNSPKPEAGSQKLVARSSVAAKSQTAALVAAMFGGQSKEAEPEYLSLHEYLKALEDRERELQRSARRPVAAKPQNSPKPEASSQKPVARSSVAANQQNSSSGYVQLTASNQKLVANLLTRHPRLQAHIQNPSRVRVAADSRKLFPGHSRLGSS